METDMKNYIEALLTERAGYEKRGKMDRVAQIDTALREVGYEHKYAAVVESATMEPEVERTVRKKAVKKREI
jgi:hypothetical protein